MSVFSYKNSASFSYKKIRFTLKSTVFNPVLLQNSDFFFLEKFRQFFLEKLRIFWRHPSSDVSAQTSMPSEPRLRCQPSSDFGAGHPSSDFGAMTSAPSELRLRRHPSSGFGAIRAQTSAPSELRLRRRPSLDFNAVRA